MKVKIKEKPKSMIEMIFRVILCWKMGTKKLAPRLAAKRVGSVPKPNENMTNAPCIADSLAKDQVSTEYTKPQGNQPQTMP